LLIHYILLLLLLNKGIGDWMLPELKLMKDQ